MASKKKLPLSLSQMFLCAAIALAAGTFLWEVVEYERMVAQNPYPVLGRVVQAVKMLILIGGVCFGVRFLWRRAVKSSLCAKVYRAIPAWAVVGVILVVAMVVRAQAVAGLGDAEKILSSMEYETARYCFILEEAPERGTIADSYLLYAVKNANESLYQLWLLPLAMHAVGEGPLSVYALNLLLEACNVLLMGGCGYLVAKKAGAAVAALLYALWPHAILACSVVSPVLLSITVLLAVLLLGMRLFRLADGGVKGSLGFATFLLLGVMLGICLHATISGVLVVPTVVAAVLVKQVKCNRENSFVLFLKSRWISGAALLVMIVLTERALLGMVGASTYHQVPDAYTATGYAAAVGVHQQADGRWNEQDAQVLQDAQDIPQVQREFWATAFQRVKDADGEKLLPFLREKLSYLWRAFVDASSQQADASPWAQRHSIIYLCLLAMMAVGAGAMLHRRRSQAGVLAAVYMAQWCAALLLAPNQAMPMEWWLCPLLLSAGMITFLQKPEPMPEPVEKTQHTSLVFKAEEIINGGVTITATKASAEQSIAELGEESLYVKAADNANLTVVQPKEE